MKMFAPMFRRYLSQHDMPILVELVTGFGMCRGSWAAVTQSNNGPAVCYCTYNASELWKWSIGKIHERVNASSPGDFNSFETFLAVECDPTWVLRFVRLSSDEFDEIMSVAQLDIPTVNDTKFRGLDGIDREIHIYIDTPRDYLWHECFPAQWKPLIEMQNIISSYLPMDMREHWTCDEWLAKRIRTKEYARRRQMRQCAEEFTKLKLCQDTGNLT